MGEREAGPVKGNGAQLSLGCALPDWECSEWDRTRYLRWMWEVSQLPWLFVVLGECRDAYKLKLARGWKTHLEEWVDYQIGAESRGNLVARERPGPTFDYYLKSVIRLSSATEDDILDGQDLMCEIGYYGISDEWRIRTE